MLKKVFMFSFSKLFCKNIVKRKDCCTIFTIRLKYFDIFSQCLQKYMLAGYVACKNTIVTNISYYNFFDYMCTNIRRPEEKNLVRKIHLSFFQKTKTFTRSGCISLIAKTRHQQNILLHVSTTSMTNL